MTQSTPLIAAIALAASVSMIPQAEARSSSHAELRGYQNCLEAASDEGVSLYPSRTYLIKQTSSENHYFINGYQWQNGERQPLRVACETSTSGRQLVNVEVANGRYRSRTSAIDVAAN